MELIFLPTPSSKNIKHKEPGAVAVAIHPIFIAEEDGGGIVVVPGVTVTPVPDDASIYPPETTHKLSVMMIPQTMGEVKEFFIKFLLQSSKQLLKKTVYTQGGRNTKPLFRSVDIPHIRSY